MPTCRSCGAPIRWGVTAAGKAMPLDAEPTTAGNMIFTGEVGAALPFVAPAQDTLFDTPEVRYMPHHATCPDAASWRRKK